MCRRSSQYIVGASWWIGDVFVYVQVGCQRERSENWAISKVLTDCLYWLYCNIVKYSFCSVNIVPKITHAFLCLYAVNHSSKLTGLLILWHGHGRASEGARAGAKSIAIRLTVTSQIKPCIIWYFVAIMHDIIYIFVRLCSESQFAFGLVILCHGRASEGHAQVQNWLQYVWLQLHKLNPALFDILLLLYQLQTYMYYTRHNMRFVLNALTVMIVRFDLWLLACSEWIHLPAVNITYFLAWLTYSEHVIHMIILIICSQLPRAQAFDRDAGGKPCWQKYCDHDGDPVPNTSSYHECMYDNILN